MASEEKDTVTIRELKKLVDQVLQTVQSQGNKIDESILLLQVMNSKVDVHGQKLQRLETDVKSVKDLLGNLPVSAKAKQSASTTEPESTQLLSVKDEIIGAVQTNTDRVKTAIEEETRQLRIDIVTKVENAEKIISHMTSEVKQVANRIEDLDKGIRLVENSTNDYSLALIGIQDNLLPKGELRDALQDLKEASVHQRDVVSEVVTKQELNTALHGLTNLPGLNSHEHLTKQEFSQKINELMQSTTEQIVSVKEELTEDIIKELVGPGGVKDLVKAHSRAIIDQTVAESQITREFVNNSRKLRNVYTCDFFVHDFEKFVITNEKQCSHLWFIDQIDTHVKSDIACRGKLVDIWLVHGRSPRMLGLDEKESPNIKAKVMLVKPGKRNWVLGCQELSYRETEIESVCDGWNTSSGKSIAKINMDKIFSQNWVDDYGKVLFRYEISIL